MNGNNPFEQSLFNASREFHTKRLSLGEQNAETDAAHDDLLNVYNNYLWAGGTRGEAQVVIAEGRLEAVMNRAKGSVS